jgi:hypothetical protein
MFNCYIIYYCTVEEELKKIPSAVQSKEWIFCQDSPDTWEKYMYVIAANYHPRVFNDKRQSNVLYHIL